MKACFQIAECSFSYAKIVQTEGNTKRAGLFLLLRCSLSYAKISIFIITTNIKKRLKRILPWSIDEDVVFLITFVSRYLIKNNKKTNERHRYH